MDETLTPQQHLLQLGRLTPPLMMIIASGLRQIGETQLAEISGLHMATCRKQLRQLADLGYLERRYRYNGYALLPKAYQAIPVIPPDRENRVLCLPTPDRGFPAGSSQERENAANQPQNRGNSAVNRGITAVVPGGGGGIYSLINKRIPPTTPDPPPDSGGSANAQIAGPTCQGKNRDWCGIFSNRPP